MISHANPAIRSKPLENRDSRLAYRSGWIPCHSMILRKAFLVGCLPITLPVLKTDSRHRPPQPGVGRALDWSGHLQACYFSLSGFIGDLGFFGA